MYYSTISDLLADVRSFYDDTNSTLYSDPTNRTNRLLMYYNRAVDEIWAQFPWQFKYATIADDLAAGELTLPADFANVGPDGYVYKTGSNQYPYVETAYQDLLAMRQRPAAYQTYQFYAIGPGAANDEQKLMVVNPAAIDNLTISYERVPPRQTSTSQPVDGPPWLHDCILAGTLRNSMESLNDGRDWEMKYRVALSNAIKRGRQLRSRAQQMPLSVGKW
jgi:hypothetical protein